MKKLLFYFLSITLLAACSDDKNMESRTQPTEIDAYGNLVSKPTLITKENVADYVGSEGMHLDTRDMSYNGPYYAKGYIGRTHISRFQAHIDASSTMKHIPHGDYWVDIYKYYTQPAMIPKGTTFQVDVCSSDNIGYRTTNIYDQSNKGVSYEKISTDNIHDGIQIITYVPVIELDVVWNTVGPYYYVPNGFLSPTNFCYRWGYFK